MANNFIVQAIVVSPTREMQKNRKTCGNSQPTHPCIAMKKTLKDLISEKKKFKLCKKL